MTRTGKVLCRAFHMTSAATTLLFPIMAVAQDATGQRRIDNAATEPGKVDQDHVTIGLGAAAIADFQGLRHYALQPVPIIDVVKGRFFARSGEGVGVKVVDGRHVQAGIGVNWMRGYDAEDVPAGIGRLKSTFGGRAFVSGQFAGFAATAAVTAPIFGGDAEGVLVNARIARPVHWGSRLTISPAIGVSWADGQYMRRTFGVDGRQAAASGLPVYQPSGGFKDVDGRMAVNYRLTRKINVIGVAMVTRNLDRVTDSPFVERRWSPAGVLGIAYTF